MTSANGIVVGVDRSPGSVHALDWALDEAVSRGVPLTALYAWDASWAYTPELTLAQDATEILAEIGAREQVWVQELVDSARERLAERVPAAADHEIVATQLRGAPVIVLLEQAQDADLLVVGRRGRGTFAHLVMGSVSSAVVHHATSPVTVVPEPRGRPGPTGPVGRHADTATVVVGVDGSEGSVRAIRYAAEVAGRRGLTLDAVCCWHVPSFAPVSGESVWTPSSEGMAEEAVTTLAHAITRAELSLPAEQVRQVVIDAAPSNGLMAYAEIAQLLVVGSRGLGGFDRLVLGSTSDQILRHAPGPVTVVPE